MWTQTRIPKKGSQEGKNCVNVTQKWRDETRREKRSRRKRKTKEELKKKARRRELSEEKRTRREEKRNPAIITRGIKEQWVNKPWQWRRDETNRRKKRREEKSSNTKERNWRRGRRETEQWVDIKVKKREEEKKKKRNKWVPVIVRDETRGAVNCSLPLVHWHSPALYAHTRPLSLLTRSHSHVGERTPPPPPPGEGLRPPIHPPPQPPPPPQIRCWVVSRFPIGIIFVFSLPAVFSICSLFLPFFVAFLS